MANIIKTKNDKIMLAALIGFAVLIGLTILINHVKTNTSAKDASDYTVTTADAKAIDSTVTRFLTTAGDFGVNYETLPTDSYTDMFDYYSVYSNNGAAFPSTLSPYVVTRQEAYKKLLTSTADAASIVYPQSDLAKITNEQLASDSDASYLSQFVVDTKTITTSDPKQSVASLNGESMPQLKVTVSWYSNYTRVNGTPGSPGEGTDTQKTNWNPSTKAYAFKDVSMVLVKSGKHWQVYSIGPTSGTTSAYSKQDYMLAVSTNNEY
jgi:hypothetical protein